MADSAGRSVALVDCLGLGGRPLDGPDMWAVWLSGNQSGMDEPWVEIEAVLELSEWGRNSYVVIRLPAELAETCRAAGTRRVEGLVDGTEVNLGLNRADVVSDAFVYAGRPLQRRVGAGTGDVVTLRLRPADPDLVPLPEDVERALADADCLDTFEQRRPAERRRLLAAVDAATAPSTRQRRIAALLRALR